MNRAVIYARTSSAANVGADKDSLPRQRSACMEYAAYAKIQVASEFYDAAVSGADPVDTRMGFMEMLEYCREHDIKVILVENASRFARDLTVQLTGHALLKKLGIDLIPVDAPTFFTDPSPTAVMIQQILGAVAQFEKASLVAKLKHGRDAKKAATGRCGGRPPVPIAARELAKLGHAAGMTLRQIAEELREKGYGPKLMRVYSPSSIKHMLEA